ncbi:ATP-binding protein [Methylobacterium segetis]|uniref:ATP-binding protein n=1 Tax=Methylobacterium segetis TaxID=2488750 RepID=UPI001A9D5B5E|nr:sensor histidine kinase [Methylobacterium segetis]
MHFRISSALKRVIGRDLITDEFVAIFELVKNAFDARADVVDVAFIDDRLFIIDNGKGMSLHDINDKWLFVAYSAKKDGTEDAGDYRDRIGARAAYAGSKGVGRFSCDRLGQTLRMQTRRKDAGGVEVINVDWELFEGNAREEFASVPVDHARAREFDLPEGLPAHEAGTVLEIGGLREAWDRDKLLKLRAALAKLINPFGGLSEAFEVYLKVPAEEPADADVLSRAASPDDARLLKVVNGPIRNFIFETLKGKTAHLEVKISDDGEHLLSTLDDRGALIYSIREPNPYPLLAGSGFSCNLFFLNRSAKKTFASRMGVPSVQFGSVFLFKNGFRIFPIGEEGVDTFGIDRRKQQGYARFLGTRDIIGRLDVAGSDENFRESTSRNQGLIDTPAYQQLSDCFDEKCLRRLERYVVGVNWKDALDLDAEDISRLRGDHASARITAIVTQLAGTEGVELLDYNRELVRLLNERSDGFTESLAGLRVLAEKSGNAAMLFDIEAAATRFQELQRAEAAAREVAERERTARRDAERQAFEASHRADVATKSFEEERKRNLFLTSITSLDKETVEVLHHQIIIHASAIGEIINGQFEMLRRGELPDREALLSTFENIAFQNKKVLSTARFATKANFRLDSENIQEDLAAYIVEYIERVAPVFSDTGVRMSITSSAKGLVRTFKPIEVAILIDNLVSNAGRADAGEISFMIEQPSAKELRITVQDDGNGFGEALPDLSRLFEKGFTTSEGSGLGLYHVAQILDDLGGSITAERDREGARFVIRIRG